MAISDYVEEFAGKPVVDWEMGKGIPDPAQTLPRLALTYDENEKKLNWADKFAEFLDHPNAAQVPGLVIGAWDWDFGGGDSNPVIETLAAAHDRLPNVKAIFLGDITYEECEISWIQQGDVTPILEAFPDLEHFAVRGGEGLRLGRVQHNHLKELTIQTGGLDTEIVRSVFASQLPQLQHLELWLGTDNYGGTVTISDLNPILTGDLFPELRYLGLRDCDFTDEIAKAIADAAILERIEVLDLSLGTLGDEGAQALLDSPLVKRLKKLDIHHHFCSSEMVSRLQELPIEVDAGETQSADEYDGETWRYVAHSE